MFVLGVICTGAAIFMLTHSLLLPTLLSAPSIFGKRPGIESFFYKGFFLPSGNNSLSKLGTMCIAAVERERANALLDADAIEF